MSVLEAGLAGAIPFVRSGAGERHAVVLLGVNALFERIDRMSSMSRYAGLLGTMLPGWRLTLVGYEETPSRPYDLDIVARNVAAAMDGPIGRANLVVAASFGGFVALRLAAARPDLVPKLVLLSAAHRFSKEGEARLKEQVEALERGDRRTLLLSNAPLFRSIWTNAAVIGQVMVTNGRLSPAFKDPELILAAYRGLFGPDFARNAEAARRVRAPTLVLGGAKDQFFDPAAFEETTALIPGARLQLFPRDTHMLAVENPAGVAKAVGAFAGG